MFFLVKNQFWIFLVSFLKTDYSKQNIFFPCGLYWNYKYDNWTFILIAMVTIFLHTFIIYLFLTIFEWVLFLAPKVAVSSFFFLIHSEILF